MNKCIKIKTILDYFKSYNIDYDFIGDSNEIVKGYSTLFNYKEDTLTFISTLNKFSDYQDLFIDKDIKLIVMGFDEKKYSCCNNVIKVNNPKSVFFDLLNYLYGNSSVSAHVYENSSQYKKHSFVSGKAIIGKNVKIGIGCVIEDDVIIGDNTVIHHNVVIRNNTRIGKNCTLYSGSIIGESGFNPLKNKKNQIELIKHYGGVIIGNNVHIGENCTISKGTIEHTFINDGTKINKQVIIAHNVQIGKGTVITSPAFICGSVKIGENCHIAANVIRNQCKIGDGATLGLGSVVIKDVESKMTVVGNPAKPIEK